MTAQTDHDDLVAQIVTASFSLTRDTATRLIDSLTEQLADSQAEVDAIRHRVQALLDSDYTPNADAILRALWPDASTRDAFRRDKEAQ
ncbi:hypothetical protein ACWT_5681 [Actinoplanes sp. SE50]|uniref:hypothetical protein n=1 Tax=unclassified Actinoplanes TaxID=2626549 RepID=UPI00023ED2D0|nr:MULTISPECIES: hypothetical protein [unclassified Actinoplanes]AEV86698.1 hypothetical protein ACPL_5811 [Actinoplanes sp. SE50/110]ATO85096.1 hypothetical protein ACWT_5681 [Actinoplanes sp. SE50]SLM02507.1 hypothetical protein ACSP50_5757 [Actinoplanes sp. SE50/110]